MSKHDEHSLRDVLIDASLHDIAERGLTALSLRVLAAKAGRSTTAVFQNFGNKNGLLLATVDEAMARDRAFHAALAADLQGLRATPAILADVLALTIERRARLDDPALRIWSELLFSSEQPPEVVHRLREWHAMRISFWTDILPPERRHDSARIATFAAMEDVYAGALAGETSYGLLLRETATHLLAEPAPEPRAPAPVTAWLSATTPAPRQPEQSGDAALRVRLLDLAAREVFEHGVTALTHRRLTAKAGVSAAMIIYHFGDMATLFNAAIWHALFAGLPDFLHDAGEDRPAARLPTMEDWVGSLERSVQPGDGDAPKGFYVNYSRIVGQLCLRARQDPALVPMVRYLRAIEGSGIHHASGATWPESLAMDRARATGFAIWIKGYATLNEALGRTDADMIRRGLAEVGQAFGRS
ncbi:TetR/AcrR family transcriptional regulator [Sphingomonas sp. AP4-R1]|uniref:TetR/AcrR family transcriptional regulator n=1 Tax=Sphingomonas sp. AP4-R1 TaxID=2735134 RepID=UPI00149351B6|nr:TetR/AcrR family transcriptional regulator [Sphingomonas sp. AP4-R1]QJU58875.1 TetR/AcrR family transcriptional regulator [Sphingomonas sp. AP4-R1]